MGVRDRRAIPLDTSLAARERQIAAWIAMGPEGRIRLAASMSDDVRRVADEGIAVRSSRSESRTNRRR